jgi:acetyl-CoA carboxylase biotin carboxylase subunit
VQWQLRIAAGERLDFGQGDLQITGHAIECRITSEDPRQGFLPSTGRVGFLSVPSGPGVRWDGGIAIGYEVSLYYDPLLGKLIVHAPDRATAIERMQRALSELRVVGLETSVPFHRWVMEEPDFRSGAFDIRYLEKHPELFEAPTEEELLRMTALAAALLEEQERQRRAVRRIAQPGAGSTAKAGAWRERGW